MSEDGKRRLLEDRPDWLACRGCLAIFTPLRKLVQDLEQHATADTRWYLFSYELDRNFNLNYGGVETRIRTRIKDGREEEGTPVVLTDLYCIHCGMHAGWRIVSEHGNRPTIYADKCILLCEW